MSCSGLVVIDIVVVVVLVVVGVFGSDGCLCCCRCELIVANIFVVDFVVALAVVAGLALGCLMFMFCCSLVYIRLIHYELPNNKTHT